MKHSFKLEIVGMNRLLNRNDQSVLRQRLKKLLKTDGIISMCLGTMDLYVEYNPDLFNLNTFMTALADIGFPLKKRLKLTSLHYAV